ncbi:MAG: hypothetical protein E6G68_07120 [Actinobacteria bacterium]|nr:MAG: hypothetical protein E6G68_07120 [Actinomycetota bacterium]
MIGLVVAVALGIAIGLARGGSFRNLSEAELRAVPLVFIGVLLQVGSSFAEHGGLHWLPLALVLASFACVAGFAALNFHLPGMALVAIGALCNLLVISSNGGMPVSLRALDKAGIGNPFTGAGAADVKGAHHILRPGTHLRFLADVIPITVTANVVSVGDIVIWAGLLLLVAELMVGPKGKRRRGAAPKVNARSEPD